MGDARAPIGASYSSSMITSSNLRARDIAAVRRRGALWRVKDYCSWFKAQRLCARAVFYVFNEGEVGDIIYNAVDASRLGAARRRQRYARGCFGRS
jgi:hypothetical protein